MDENVVKIVKPLGISVGNTGSVSCFVYIMLMIIPGGMRISVPTPAWREEIWETTSWSRMDFECITVKQFPDFRYILTGDLKRLPVVRKGIVDHSDSLGGAGRYGHGDVQWMTAGKGIQHAEMFPLLDRENGESAGAFPDLAQSSRC